MNERVSVTVNGKTSTFFLGLSVRHAVGTRAAKAVQAGRAEVCDPAGNEVGLDGALYDGETLIVRDLTLGGQPASRASAAQRAAEAQGAAAAQQTAQLPDTQAGAAQRTAKAQTDRKKSLPGVIRGFFGRG